MQIISILTICNTPVRAAVVAHALRLECRGPNPARVSSRELQPLLVHGHGHRVVFIFGKLRLQLRKHLFLFFPHVLFEERAELAQFSCPRSEEHTSELQSLMRISYAVFCLKKKKKLHHINVQTTY